jgi:hypothetical protein
MSMCFSKNYAVKTSSQLHDSAALHSRKSFEVPLNRGLVSPKDSLNQGWPTYHISRAKFNLYVEHHQGPHRSFLSEEWLISKTWTQLLENSFNCPSR